MTCPLCAGRSRQRFQSHGFWIRDCLDCGHRFAAGGLGADHVARVYDADYFAGGGSGYPDYIADGEAHRDRGRWYGKLLARHMPAGSVLDVGAAAGYFVKGLEDCGWRASGIEPNAAMAAHARDRLGLDVRATSFESSTLAGRFDLVSMIQVVAHFLDPRGAIERAASVLRPGGHVLIETWDRESWHARIAGQRWHEYSPPSVLHWFSRRGLAQLGERTGLRAVAAGRPRKRISVAHARSLWRHKYGEGGMGRVLGLLPARASLPYPGDDLFWLLLQRDSSSSIS